MRATRVLEAATYAALGSVVAAFFTLCLLALSDLQEIETRLAEISGLQAAMAESARVGAELAAGEPVKSQTKQGWAQTATACSTCEPPPSGSIPANAVPDNRADTQRLGEQMQGLRPVKLASSVSPMPGSAVVHPALSTTGDLGDVLLVWGEAPRLLREGILKVSQDGGLGEAAVPDAVRRLRERAVLIGVSAVVSGLLLLVLIRSSFGAKKAETREVARAKENLEVSAKECTAELQRAITTLRLHSAHVDAAIEDERVRIAHDIHDELGSILTALKFELSGLSGGRAEGGRKPMVRRASTDLVDSALLSVRSLIAALHPYPLERAGLWGALVWKAGAFEKSVGIPCRVVMSEDLPQPSKGISVAAFRIVEEALTNVARHARAAAVKIVVHFVAGQLVIEITDDGCGIPNGAPVGAASYGLTGMRERARAVGGALALAAGADRGTTVRFSVQDAVQPPLDGKAS